MANMDRNNKAAEELLKPKEVFCGRLYERWIAGFSCTKQDVKQDLIE